MAVQQEVVDALADGWRNIDAYPISGKAGKRAHAESTVASLRKAGYEIVKLKEGQDGK